MLIDARTPGDPVCIAETLATLQLALHSQSVKFVRRIVANFASPETFVFPLSRSDSI